MRTGRPKQPLILTAEERERLQSLAHRARSQAALARRARVVLACGDGLDNQAVAKKLRCSLGMVGKWRGRFLKARLEGLYDEPRPGAPRKVSDEQVEQVVIQTLESTPRGQTHWSTRGLAQATGLSRMTVSRIWHAFGLQPHRTDTFKLSPDPLLIEKVRDIAGLYINPPDQALVLCVDEKRHVQALDRTQRLLPMQLGLVAEPQRTGLPQRHGANFTCRCGRWVPGANALTVGHQLVHDAQRAFYNQRMTKRQDKHRVRGHRRRGDDVGFSFFNRLFGGDVHGDSRCRQQRLMRFVI